MYEKIKNHFDAAILENVPEYKPALARKMLPPCWHVTSMRLDPRAFGFGAARPRVYILMYNTAVLKWDEGCADFKELLLELGARPQMTAGDYSWDGAPVRRALSDAQAGTFMNEHYFREF